MFTLKKTIQTLGLAAVLFAPVAAKEISVSDGADFSITTRTTFGWDIDNPYRYGFASDFLKFSLLYHLFPYQELTNKVKSTDPVGFIDLTLFNLDLNIFNQGTSPLGYNAPGNVQRDRLQTGTFKSGIVFGDFILQLKAGGNEPFAEPWNKAFEFVNDSIKVSWASLESMVDVVRLKTLDQIKPSDGPAGMVQQFQQSAVGSLSNIRTDNQSLDISSTMIALMYNTPGFGFNVKVGTEKSYLSETITETDMNGFAYGLDLVLSPTELAGFRTLFSGAGSIGYGTDTNADPIGAGLKVAYDIAIDEATSIEPFVAVDIGTSIPDASAAAAFVPVGYEIAGGLVYHWPGKGGWYTDYIVGDEGRVFPGLSLSYSLVGVTSESSSTAVDPAHNVKFTLFEERGDEGLFYGMGSEIILDVKNFAETDKAVVMATAYLDYSVPGFAEGSGTLLPWVILAYDNLPGATDPLVRNNNFKVDLGVKLIDAIANTTLGLAWDSGNLITESEPIVAGLLRVTADIKF